MHVQEMNGDMVPDKMDRVPFRDDGSDRLDREDSGEDKVALIVSRLEFRSVVVQLAYSGSRVPRASLP